MPGRATRAHADRVAALRAAGRTIPLSGVSLAVLGAALTMPVLIGAQSKGRSLGRLETASKGQSS